MDNPETYATFGTRHRTKTNKNKNKNKKQAKNKQEKNNQKHTHNTTLGIYIFSLIGRTTFRYYKGGIWY